MIDLVTAMIDETTVKVTETMIVTEVIEMAIEVAFVIPIGIVSETEIVFVILIEIGIGIGFGMIKDLEMVDDSMIETGIEMVIEMCLDNGVNMMKKKKDEMMDHLREVIINTNMIENKL